MYEKNEILNKSFDWGITKNVCMELSNLNFFHKQIFTGEKEWKCSIVNRFVKEIICKKIYESGQIERHTIIWNLEL